MQKREVPRATSILLERLGVKTQASIPTIIMLIPIFIATFPSHHKHVDIVFSLSLSFHIFCQNMPTTFVITLAPTIQLSRIKIHNTHLTHNFSFKKVAHHKANLNFVSLLATINVKVFTNFYLPASYLQPYRFTWPN